MAVAGLVLCVLFWAINTVIAKGVVQEISPMALSFYRWLTALVFILPFSFRQMLLEKDIILSHLPALFMLALPSVAVYNSMLYLGAQYTSATNISIVVASMPAMTLGLSWAINKDRTSFLQTLGIFVSLAGVLVILTKARLAVLADLGFNPGDLLILAAAGSWALYSVLLKKNIVPVSALSFLTMTIIIGWVCILPFYLWEYTIYRGFELTLSTVWIFVYLGICPSILSYICWNFGVKILGSARAAIFIYLLPVFTSAIAYFILDERLLPFHFLGGIMVFLGLVLSSREGISSRI